MLEKHKLLNTFSQNLAIMGTTFYFRIAYKCEISIVFWFFKADYVREALLEQSPNFKHTKKGRLHMGNRRSWGGFVVGFASGKFAYVREPLLEQSPDFKGAKKARLHMGNKRSWEALKESFALAGLLMLGGIRGRLCIVVGFA